jgi:hypothetical protein
LALARSAERIHALSAACGRPTDLPPYQFAQLVANTLEFAPDLIIELGRGYGNSTCAFVEAANQLPGPCRVLSLCISQDWEQHTRPRVAEVVPEGWFERLEALNHDILTYDWKSGLAGAKRVLLFWDAHGFEVAACVLGAILPEAAGKAHLVMMHDLSDARYGAPDVSSYKGHGIWSGNNWNGPRLRLGNIDTAVEQAIAALDFTTRNQLTLESADHSHHTVFDGDSAKNTEMKNLLGELFDTQGHWFYFTMNEHAGPYHFPRFRPPEPEIMEPAAAEPAVPEPHGLSRIRSLFRHGATARAWRRPGL